MAQSLTPADYVDPGVLDNYDAVAAERGYDTEGLIVALSLEQESPVLAAALRQRAAEQAAEAAGGDEQSRSEAPKGRRSGGPSETA